MDNEKLNDATPNFDTDSSAKEVVSLYLDDIIPNRFQPRERFDENALKELAASIKEHGVIQPIIVRKIGDKYEIIAGERRYKASAMAGLTKIPAIIRNLDDKESSKVALLENLQRKNLSAIEEARTYQKILDLDQMTQYELAKTMGKSQPAVANKLRLLTLPDEVQDALLKEKISERHARSLLNLENENDQIDMLHKIINTRMTVRELDEEIKSKNKSTPLPGLESPTESLLTKEEKKEDSVTKYEAERPIETIDKLLNINSDNNYDAVTTPDLEELRNRSKDINKVEEPIVDLDKLIKLTPENDSKEAKDDFKFVPDFNKETENIDAINNKIENQLESIQPTFESSKEEIKETNEILDVSDDADNQEEKINSDIEQLEINDKKPTKDEAVQKVQNVIEELKKSGIEIDSEGMDFGETYQIIIRINKSE
ncbi:MAG: ParB/RepB/Spo0J family partition protein [Bacilli bacterium]